MKQAIAATMGSLGLVLFAGCVDPGMDAEATDDPDPAATSEPENDEQAGLLLRVEVESGHTVGFYEPIPGGLYVAEQMRSGQKFVLGDREVSDALAAFARVRPAEEVPAALREAYDRARASESEPATAARVEVGGGSAAEVFRATEAGTAQLPLTSSSAAGNFVNNDGGCNWGPHGSICRVNWGGGFFVWATSSSGLCIVDHYAGNGVTIQITVGAGISSTFQAVNTSVQYGLGTPGFSTTRRLDILNAAGDSFHAGCRWGI